MGQDGPSADTTPTTSAPPTRIRPTGAPLEKVPSNPALEARLEEILAGEAVQKKLGGKIVEVPDDKWSRIGELMHIKGLEKIPGIIQELKDAVAKEIPEATRIADTTKLYFANSPHVNMSALTLVSPDKASAVSGIKINAQTLFEMIDSTGSLNTGMFRAYAAHEVAHTIVGALNPNVGALAKYRPHTPKFFKQKQEIMEEPLTADEQKRMTESVNRTLAKFPQYNNDQGRSLIAGEFMKGLRQNKADATYKELQADIIGIRLSKDVGVAVDTQRRLNGGTVRGVLDDPGRHSDIEVRVAEIEQAGREMLARRS